jgi:threonine dehydrogenase-like Zn-dependent dehydrogenase
MRALTYHGSHPIQVETARDPALINDNDLLLRVTATTVCGSGLPAVSEQRVRPETRRQSGTRIHACRGDNRTASRLQRGDRVVISFTIVCGDGFFCEKLSYAAYETTIPDETHAHA